MSSQPLTISDSLRQWTAQHIIPTWRPQGLTALRRELTRVAGEHVTEPELITRSQGERALLRLLRLPAETLRDVLSLVFPDARWPDIENACDLLATSQLWVRNADKRVRVGGEG